MKTVVEMAREVGFTDGELAWHDHMLERFAELVRVTEREACAKVFEGKVGQADLRDIAAAIRARGSNT